MGATHTQILSGEIFFPARILPVGGSKQGATRPGIVQQGQHPLQYSVWDMYRVIVEGRNAHHTHYSTWGNTHPCISTHTPLYIQCTAQQKHWYLAMAHPALFIVCRMSPWDGGRVLLPPVALPGHVAAMELLHTACSNLPDQGK